MDFEETLQIKPDLILKMFFTFSVEIISDSIWPIIQIPGKRGVTCMHHSS